MRRPALLLGAVLILALVLLARCGPDRTVETRPSADVLTTIEREPSPSAAPVESPAPIATEATETAAVEAARAFLTVFATPPLTEADRAVWNREMTERATPALAEMLHWTETDRLPVGDVVGASAVDVGETTASVAVTLDSEETLVVDLVTDGTRWQVADVREPRQ
jgi:hypothetical protein